MKVATKVKPLTKQEQRQQLSDHLEEVQADLAKIHDQNVVVREDLRQLKEDRDATQRSLADYDRMIREKRAEYERVMDNHGKAQAEVAKLTGLIQSLGE